MTPVTSTDKIRFLRGIFRDVAVSRDGSDIAVPCPNCKTPDKKKLSVNIDTWKYHCWVCGIKGSNLRFALRQYCSPETYVAFRERFGGSDDELIEVAPINVVQLPEDATPIALVSQSRNPNFRAAHTYLMRRGLSERDLWYWKACVSAERQFDRRVIIPSFDYDGDLNYYVSRAIDKDTNPRYVNSKANKVDIIFNDLMVDWDKPIYVVEGVFDAIKVGQNAVPILGSYLPQTSALFTKIVARNIQVVLALDPDVIDKTHKIASDLYKFGIDVSVADTSGFKDIGEMTRAEAKSRIENAVSWLPRSGMLHKISKISSGSIL